MLQKNVSNEPMVAVPRFLIFSNYEQVSLLLTWENKETVSVVLDELNSRHVFLVSIYVSCIMKLVYLINYRTYLGVQTVHTVRLHN
jgi:hypothetical protein